jgi:hypothetical protein
MEKDIIYNINPAERIVRLVFSVTLAVIPLHIDAPLGGFLLLPLLALYPGLTATLGWDPLLAAATRSIRTETAAGGEHAPVVHA